MFRSAKALDRAKTHASFRQAMESYRKTAENWFDGTVDAIDRRIAHVDKLLHHIRATVARMDFADSATQLREAQTLSADRSALVEFKRDLLTGAADYSTWQRDAGNHEHDNPDYAPKGGVWEGQQLSTPPVGKSFMSHDPRAPIGPGRHRAAVSGQPSDIGAAPAAADDGADTAASRPADAYSQTAGPAAGHRPPRPRRGPGGAGGSPLTAALSGLPPSDRRWVTLESSRFVSANTDCLSDPEELATRAQHHAAIKTSTFTRQHSAEVTRAFVSSVVELGKKTYRPSPVKTAAVDIGFDPEALFL